MRTKGRGSCLMYREAAKGAGSGMTRRERAGADESEELSPASSYSSSVELPSESGERESSGEEEHESSI